MLRLEGRPERRLPIPGSYPRGRQTRGACCSGVRRTGTGTRSGRSNGAKDSSELLPDGSSSVLVSVNGSTLRPIQVTGGLPTVVAASKDRVFVGLAAGDRGSAIVSLKPDGRDQKQVAGPVSGAMPAMWYSLLVSPDGKFLAATAQGDDGYSRAYLAPTSGGDLTGLTQRRDTRAHAWNAKGDRLFFIEGNSFQGEQTALFSVKRDGSARRMIVTGVE